MKTPRNDQVVPAEELARHVTWARRLACALVRDRDAADDITQEALVVAAGRAPSPGAPIRPWLGGVVRNVFLHYQRSRSRRRCYESEAAQDGDAVPTADALLETVQLQRTLAHLLEEMSEPLRTTLLLHYYQGLSSAEIARSLGLPASTVRSRLALGLEFLRKRLDEKNDGDRDRWKRALLPLTAFPAARPAPVATSSTVAVAVAAAVLTAGVVFGPGARRDLAGTRGQQAGRASGARAPDSRPATAATATAATDRWANRDCADGEPSLGPEVGGARPRLLVTRDRLCHLRAARTRAGSPLAEIAGRLQARVDAAALHEHTVEHLNYARAHRAQAAAFTYLLTGERRYAQAAFAAVEAMYADESRDFTPTNGHGMARAATGMGLALAYDWAYHGLDADQRATLARRLEASLEAWRAFRHANVEGTAASYWVPMCRGVELLQMLALGAEGHSRERFSELRSALAAHLRDAYGGLGTSEEGIGHVARAGLYLLPALFALRGLGIDELDPLLARTAFWKLAAFAGATAADGATGRAPILQTGISANVTEEAGWASLVFGTVPPDELGRYRHFYDRHVGAESGRPAELAFDAWGAGWVWALLHYRDDVPASDPTDVWPRAIADDEHGAYYFRGGWRGAGDVQVVLQADRRSHRRGWDVAEAFNLGVRAHGVAFAGGGGPARTRHLGSGLLVDGRSHLDRADVGAPELFLPGASGGYVVVDGGTKYRRLGLTSARRHLLVDLAIAGAPSIVTTLDVLRADGAHAYTFQLNPGDHVGDDGITVEQGRESGRPTFTMTAPTGAHLKGWVMSPPQVEIETTDGLRVTTRGSDVDLWIVMTIGNGPPPRGSARGNGLHDGELSVAGAAVRFDPRRGTLVLDRR